MGPLIGWTWMRDNYKEINERFSGGMFSGINRFITVITSQMTSGSLINEAEQYFLNGSCYNKTIVHPPLADKAAQEGLEHAYAKKKWLETNAKDVIKWIISLKLQDS